MLNIQVLNELTFWYGSACLAARHQHGVVSNAVLFMCRRKCMIQFSVLSLLHMSSLAGILAQNMKCEKRSLLNHNVHQIVN